MYGSFNGQGNWIMYHQGSDPEERLGLFAPNDFEIRVTEAGSYGFHPFTTGRAIRVPFEVWDIGDVGPFGVNDTTDDEQIIPTLFSPNGGECFFGFGETAEDPIGLGWPVTDGVYAYYTTEGQAGYAQWESAIKPLVDAHPDACPEAPETDEAAKLIDFDRNRPLQRLIFMMDPDDSNYRDEMIPVGNVVRFLTTRIEPPQPSAPAPGTTVSSEVTLYWQLPPNADSSRIQISTSPDFSTVTQDRIAFERNLVVEGLSAGTYYWRVSYGSNEWSEIWNFVVSSRDDDRERRNWSPDNLGAKAGVSESVLGSDDDCNGCSEPTAGHPGSVRPARPAGRNDRRP